MLKPVNFHQVNKVLGHHTSDILLLQLAYNLHKFTETIPELVNLDEDNNISRIARMQGLEFLVIYDLSLTQHPEAIVINDLCEKLTRAVPDALSFKNFSLNFSLAFGVSLSDKQNNSMAEFFAHAQDALLLAEQDRAFIRYYDNNLQLYTEQQLVRMELLKQAIEQDSFNWYLHPHIHTQTKKIVGFSLGVSWQPTDQDECLDLCEFITIAELSGDVYTLTKLMIIKAFKSFYQLKQLGLYIPISINLTSKDLLEPDLGDFLQQQLSHYGIAAKYVMISLDESVVVGASERTKAMIDQLKSFEFPIAINDFSGSYEALRYIRRLAINQVRINCEHLVETMEHATDKVIIDTLVTLTRSMKIPLLATHVDSKAIEHAYCQLGGELICGDVITEGITLDKIAGWIKQWQQFYPQHTKD
jgi:EAL domain-containing protein (putative c-di-GMP-specific phosphodiesterase class I)/GGDEF domain-containing protein